MPIRILHVVTNMDRGGIETMLMNYYRHIDREVVQFDFLVHRIEVGAYDTEIQSLGGVIYRLPKLNPWDIHYRYELHKFFQAHHEYSIVHSHLNCMSSLILKEAQRCGIPVRIAHSHNSTQDKNLKYIIKMFYKKQIPRYATKLFACGEEAGAWMFGSNQFEILNNAIPAKEYIFNVEKRSYIRKQLSLEDEFTIGLVGRFSPQKNHIFLLDIFSELVKLDPTAKLLLIGDGELRSEIERKISELGLHNNVILLGIRSDVTMLLQAMDAFVMPSKYEGLPLAIIEAQSAGLPCFISDKVPIECKLTDKVYQLSLSDSTSQWASAINMIKGVSRENTFNEIAKAGFDIETNVKTLQNYYISQICN